MKMITFWYWICLLYLLINISILIDESYEIIYKMSDQDQSIQYLVCFNLNEIIINETKINTNEIKNEFNHHLRWIQKNKKDKRGRFITNEAFKKIINQTKSRDHLIYRNRICFVFSNRNDFNSFSLSLNKLPIYKNYFVLNNETFSFLEFNNTHSQFSQLFIQHKEYPYSDCSKDYSNFKCLNDKIKKIQRLSRYYYRSDDNESIELNYQINQTIIDNEIRVIKQCNQIDCNINLLYPIDRFMKSEFITLKSFPYIPKLDFYLQLIGLIVLFLNISIYDSIKLFNSLNLKPIKIKFFKFIKQKLKKIRWISTKLKLKKIKKIMKKLKFKRLKLIKYIIRLRKKYLKINNLILLIVLIIIICLTILFSRSIYNFIQERDYPFNKIISVNSIRLELSVVICVSIYEIKGFDYDIFSRSLSKLEKKSDNGLNIVLKDIYLEFLNKRIPTKWQLESKLIRFKYDLRFGLLRCFQLRIFLNQPKYQTIFAVTKLIIEFYKNKDGDILTDIFILTDNEIFNSNSYQHFPDYNFRKRILERSKLNKIKKCKDYNQLNDNCESKWNCIDQCTTKGIYNQIKNLTKSDYLLIDKNHFTDNEWSNLFIETRSKYNEELYSNISKECEDKYSKFVPCTDIKFEHHSEINYKLSNKKEIDLNYEVINFREEEPLMLKLLLDLLNIQSIFFNLNVLKLLVFLFKLKFNFNLNKTFKFFIYLICFSGLILHLRFIFIEIIKGQLINNEFYEINSTIRTPDLIFCFDFNHTKLTNQNYKLTYQYLDKITSDQLREDQIFDRIEYLNQSNKWIKLNNETNFQDDNLEIRIFYYLDRKCFRIIQKNIEYNRNQFQFNNMTEDGLVFKIFLNRTHLNKEKFYFFTKSINKIQYSKIQELKLKGELFKENSFKIKHEIIDSDRFNLMKNPLSLNDEEDLNDSDKLLKKLLDYFEELNLVTFKLPFKKNNSNSNYELNDNLFVQLYNNLEKKLNQISSKYERQYSFNSVVQLHKPANVDFEFSLSFIQKVIVVTNETSSAKLIINLLNALSLWFNLCIFDLHIYLYLNKIRLAFIYLFELLLKFRKKIFLRIIYDDWYY